MDLMSPERIKALRLSSGRTLAEFAKLVGVSISAVSSWETGRGHPRYPAQERLNEIADDLASGNLKPLLAPVEASPVRRGPRQPKESRTA